ncbi:MAG: AraC family transcriptional regulator [Desulfobacterales bacterium]|nr:AraC family transcriptional regulator [Desulfobacterales bacterium]
MSDLCSLASRFAIGEGFTESRLTGVRFFKSLNHIPRAPLLYDPGISIVFQGHKIGYLGDQIFQYDADNYLVVSVTMPFECETFATPEAPLMGMYIDVDIPTLHELIANLGESQYPAIPVRGALPKGIGPAAMDHDLKDAVARLLNVLTKETETRILGPGLVREIIYRVLCGTQGPLLHALAVHNGNFARIAGVLRMIQADYAQKLDVETMAGKVNMSASAFHRVFKEITAESPMQYLKKIRLTRARELLVEKDMKAYMAADRVGYESPSQFSREFKRYFGQTPADLLRELRVA